MDYEFIQFAAFVSQPAEGNAATVWAKLFDDPYLNFGTMSPGHTTASAQFGSLAVQLQVQPGRVDVLVSAAPAPGSAQSKPPAMPDLDGPLSLVRMAYDKLCSDLSPNRVALVVQAHEVVATEAAAAARIAEIIPVQLAPKATDLSFQVNVRLASEAQKGLMVNRLCRWSMGQMFWMEFQVPNVAGAILPQAPTNHLDFVQTFVDINTVPGASLHQARLPGIIDELIAEAKAIILNGHAHL